jgi:hypothetical protein
MFQWLNQHFKAYHILVPQQYNFEKNSSMDNATFKLINTILNAWNKKT